MRLNAPQGQKVEYVEHPGEPWGGEDARQLLQPGSIYTVADTAVFRSYSLVRLAELPNHEFSTMQFKEVGELLPEVESVEDIYMRGVMNARHGDYQPYDEIEE